MYAVRERSAASDRAIALLRRHGRGEQPWAGGEGEEKGRRRGGEGREKGGEEKEKEEREGKKREAVLGGEGGAALFSSRTREKAPCGRCFSPAKREENAFLL